MAKIDYNGLQFETESPLKAFYWLTAVRFFDYDAEAAESIATFAYGVYIDFDDIDALRLIDFVCENYPNMSFTDMVDELEE